MILFDYNNENLDETDVVLKREQCDDTAAYLKQNGGSNDVQRVGNNYRKNEFKIGILYRYFFCF